MGLKESLAKFKKQQEKCQSTLTSIPSRTASSRATQSQKATPASTPSSAPARTPTAPVKFSSDTKRLQYINNIRKSPVGAQIKRVLDLLLETRQTLTPEQINESCYVDINSNKALFNSLRNNPKVNYDGKHFSYKPNHDLKDKDQLLVLIRKFPEGIVVNDLKDAYPTVLEDLQALKAAGQVWVLSNLESREDIAYPNDPRVPIKVDDDLKQLFRGIKLPRDIADMEGFLREKKEKLATNTAKRKAMAEMHGIAFAPKSTSNSKKKQHKSSKKAKKHTNSHVPEVLNFMDTHVPISQ